MSETFCLQWNEFKPNAFSMLSSAWENKEYIDLTLTCEDNQQMEAHKVILASSSSIKTGIPTRWYISPLLNRMTWLHSSTSFT